MDKRGVNVVAGPEYLHQKALFDWAKTVPELKWMHSIPNGTVLAGNASKRAIQMASLKATGLKPGVWDIFLPLAKHGYHGLYIEMKAGKNKLSEAQDEFGNHVHRNGYLTATCWTWDEARQVLEDYIGKAAIQTEINS